MKRVLLLISSFLALAIVLPNSATAQVVTSDNAYQAMVKINVYVLNHDFFTVKASEGTGIIFSSGGLVLTNYHVIHAEYVYDNSEAAVGYQICLTEAIEDEPNCSFTAKLVAKDKDLDLAILQMEPISGLTSQTQFPYLELMQTDQVAISDDISALGYPELGGGTISITKGIISGKVNRYGKQWIKTDALISYGSSGGAIINDDGKVIGITTFVYSDLLGSLGFAININSVKNWIDSNKIKSSIPVSLTEKTRQLTILQKNIDTQDTYEDSQFQYSITKPSDWNFTHLNEVQLLVTKKSDNESGGLLIGVDKMPFSITVDFIEMLLKDDFNNNLSLGTAVIVKNETVTLGGKLAKKVQISNLGGTTNWYFIPQKNYIIKISYEYGTNEKDKSTIDGIIASMSLVDISASFTERKTYTNSKPKFSIQATDGWVLRVFNNKTNPFHFLNKNNNKSIGKLFVEKKTSEIQNLTND